jgi:dolichol-phosphate mannosyltransferase
MTSTLVITTRNEIHGCKALLPKLPLSKFDEVLVIDLNSRDGTREYLQGFGLRIVAQEKPGRGEAIRLAASIAACDVMVFFAPDGNEDPGDLVRLRDLVIAGNDMVIASRFMPGARNEEDDFVLRPRAWANRLFTAAVRLVWGGNITDTINGFRAIRRDKLLALKTDEVGFSIEFQMSIRALKLGYRVLEFSTIERNRIGGHSSAYAVPTGLRVLRALLREIVLGKRF